MFCLLDLQFVHLNPYLVIVGSPTKNFSIRRCVIIVTIFVLYTFYISSFGKYWAFIHHAFIDEGQNCYTVFMAINGFDPIVRQEKLVDGITACTSTFIADTSLVSNKRPYSSKTTNHYSNSHLLDLAVLDCVEPSMAHCYHPNTLYYSRHR